MLPRTPDNSLTVLTEMVMPNDTNALNNLMGGNLLCWMDVTSAICARRHAGCVCVTASVDKVSFDSPIRMGEIVTLTAKATRVFNTSMEVHIEVHAEGMDTTRRRKCNEAYFTFVGIDEWGNKLSLPAIEPSTDEEKLQYDNALQRRELRLVLAGKMKASESEHLKTLFDS
jgi:acyl-CoA hydrolase